ncbi:DUF6701 domain-containing protein [Thiohalorhabdus methylotrophus]|uniref:DUF6701 domain-containing protein n=1 Tax=Thiohalorhabdus methylotrophus TaxID=3242694 RepID=A0ABV4TYC8_9GAMM
MRSQANINEITFSGASVEFVELEILENDVSVSGWRACYVSKNVGPDCVPLGNGAFTVHPDGSFQDTFFSPYYAQTWLVYPFPNPTPNSTYGEVVLLDGSDRVLDYLRYCKDLSGNKCERYWQVSGACGADFEHGSTNVKDISRRTDGDGPWEETTEETQGETNTEPQSPDPAEAVAYYAMEEAEWDGTTGEVRDSSSSGNHGTASGLADTVADAKAGCRAGRFPLDLLLPRNAVDTGLDVDGEIGSQGTIAFWYKANRDWDAGGGNWLVDGSSWGALSVDIPFHFRLDGSGALEFTLADEAGSAYAVTSGAFSGLAGTWVHLALTWRVSPNFQELAIYKDGDRIASQTWSRGGTRLADVAELFLGDARWLGNSARGLLDEAYIFSGQLTEQQIRDLMGRSRDCNITLDQFRIDHDGAGINCLPETVTLAAVGSSGTPVPDYTGTVTLSTSTGNGTWTLQSGNGTLSDPSADDGTATYTFAAADGGEVTLALRNTHRERLNIDAADGTVSDVDDSGDMVFRPYGFLVTPDPLPDQVAGRAFDLTLTAAGEIPSDPGCGVIEEYSGDQELRFWTVHENPASGIESVTVDGTAIPDSEAAAGDRTVRFTDGRAQVRVNYPDAGSIRIRVKDETGIGEPPAGSGSEVIGGSDAFVWRPFGFDVQVPADTAETGPSGAVLAAAGQPFTAGVRAVVWQAADDADGNGAPDSGADLADNATTPNFGNETNPETVELAPAVVAPASGENGDLVNAAFDFSPAGASGGVSRSDVEWSEVGYVELAASLMDGDYLGAGGIAGRARQVGRFIPHHFRLSAPGLTNRADLTGCADPFTYIGEPFDMRFTLTAENRHATPTANFRGDYARLDSAAELSPGATDGNRTLTGSLSVANAAFSAWADPVTGTGPGSAEVSLRLSLVRDGPEGPYAPFRVGIAPRDEDGVTLQSYDLDLDGDGGDDHALVDRTELRYGRLYIQNAHGPETENLEVPVLAQYFTGTHFERNVQDGCTPLSRSGQSGTGRIRLSDGGGWVNADQAVGLRGGSGGQTEGTAVTGIDGGNGILTLLAPGAGSTGYAEVRVELGAHPWLRGDWDNDGSHSDDPEARAVFGRYRGDDRILYWQEIFP